MVNAWRPAVWPVILLLSACSGGGGGGGAPSSTPAPPTSPTGPSGSTTPGQSGATDPPSLANTSLLAPNASESFINDAVTANVHLNAAKAGKATIKVVYDAASKSYRIDATNRTQTFAPADINAAQGDATTTVYTRSANGTTDLLSLTKPGTSGHLTYQYVGSGIWQHVPSTGPAAEAHLAAFTYGVETPDSALPRTGSAAYAIDLRGIVSAPVVSTLDGSGTLQANFATGELTTVGAYTQCRTDGSGFIDNSTFSGAAQIASASNGFDGMLRLGGFSADGTLAGRFYGPKAEEVGATFQLVDSTSSAVVGTLTGRQDSSIPFANTRLTSLFYDQTFPTTDSRQGFSYFANGDIAGWWYPVDQDAALTYSASNQTYKFKNSEIDLTFGLAGRDAARSDAHQTTYTISSGDLTGRASLFTPGSTNDQIAMTYASFGHLAIQDNSATSTDAIKSYDVYFAYGAKTALLPKGNGQYDGSIFGRANVLSQGGSVANFDVTGAASLKVDFQYLTMTGNIAPIGTNSVTGSIRDFGNYNVSGSISNASLSPAFAGDAVASSHVNAGLFGPNAEELAGIFSLNTPNDHGTGDFVQMQGAVLAKRR